MAASAQGVRERSLGWPRVHVTLRTATPFDARWSLQEYIDLFAADGQFLGTGSEMFGLTSWVQVMLGQGLHPRGYHPAVDWVADPDLYTLVDHIEKVVASNATLMPAHEQFIAHCCAAGAR